MKVDGRSYSKGLINCRPKRTEGVLSSKGWIWAADGQKFLPADDCGRMMKAGGMHVVVLGILSLDVNFYK